ncbi:MAG: hypothetical protein ACFFD2_19885 [Promethearchaeota archaeon]
MNDTKLIKAIFIFDKKSGRPFIRRTFGGFNAEPFLVMGFLNAIMKFAKEVGKSDCVFFSLKRILEKIVALYSLRLRIHPFLHLI